MCMVVGEGMDAEGMSILVDYREDGATPFMMFIAEGLVEEKA